MHNLAHTPGQFLRHLLPWGQQTEHCHPCWLAQTLLAETSEKGQAPYGSSVSSPACLFSWGWKRRCCWHPTGSIFRLGIQSAAAFGGKECFSPQIDLIFLHFTWDEAASILMKVKKKKKFPNYYFIIKKVTLFLKCRLDLNQTKHRTALQ